MTHSQIIKKKNEARGLPAFAINNSHLGIISYLILVTVGLAFPQMAKAGGVSNELEKVVRAAEKASYRLSASKVQERISLSRISIKEGNYWPQLEFAIANNPGFPGSGQTLNIGGPVGSPFRAGAAMEVLLSGTLWDFGRTSSAIRTAEHEALADRADTDIQRGEIELLAVNLYFECARYFSHMKSWSFILGEADLVRKEVERSVSTGRRNVSDQYLSLLQFQHAAATQSDFEERMKLTKKRLSILTQISVEDLQCPSIEAFDESHFAIFSQGEKSPTIAYSLERLHIAEVGVDKAYAEFMPKLRGFASVAMMQNAHYVEKQNFGVGIGLSVPLFEGFKTINGLTVARAEVEKHQNLLSDTHFQIAQANVQYDQLIESAKDRLQHLENEDRTAAQGFNSAKKRYFSWKGSLIDLREALRSLSLIRSDRIDTQLSYWLASIQKLIYNGRRVKESS